MKKIALIFLTLTLISCTLDSNSTDNDTVLLNEKQVLPMF